MIEAKLIEFEESVAEGKGNDKRLKTIGRFKEWLKQIDRKAEVVPINDVDRLTSLMVSLKGEDLSNDELELVVEIVRVRK